MKYPRLINPSMIAPCGMNCAICIGFLREKNPCGGCRGEGGLILKGCLRCVIRKCGVIAEGPGKFCFQCGKFPCARLKQLDKRYRTRYRMSMLDNLENIRRFGIREFVKREKARWTCGKCGGILSAHRDACLYCGRPRPD